MMIQIRDILICSLLLLHFSKSSVISLKSEVTSCKKEGEKIVVDGVTNNPCLVCVCQNLLVDCRIKHCDHVTCYNQFQSKEECCTKCQGCDVNGVHFEPSPTWTTTERCQALNCNDGIVTRTVEQCFLPCKDKLEPLPGQCCPRCKNCVLDNGKILEEQQSYSLSDQPCIKCVCQEGSLTCQKIVCPVLPCGLSDQQMSADGCCAQCIDSRIVFLLSDGQCWFRKMILPDKSIVRIDKCTLCTCTNGTVICDRESCPPLINCPLTEQLTWPDKCCPLCKRDMFDECLLKNNSKITERWKDSSDPCSDCGCEDEEIICRRVSCPTDIKCTKQQTAQLLPGNCCPVCVQEPGVCTVFGDPHYVTFDRRQFSYQGDCAYVLSRDCEQRHYSVVVSNDAKRTRAYSWTSSVELTLQSTDNLQKMIFSLHHRLIAKLNGKRLTLPYITNHVTIRADRGFLRLRSLRGIWLDWDGDNYLSLSVHPQFQGALCGLCGNYNGYGRDDFYGSDGLFRSTPQAFAETWKVSDSVCTRPDYTKKMKDPCDGSLEVKIMSQKKCSIFKTSSFQPCYKLVDPVNYYKSCLTDTCNCYWDQSCACESIKAYVIECARHDINITLELGHYCKKTCRKGKIFSSCGPACHFTCRNYKNQRRRKRCQKRSCVSGCHCPVGYVIKRGRCIKSTQCRKSQHHSRS